MNYYLISDIRNNATIGIYKGDNEEGAWRACAKDIGDPGAEKTDEIEVRELEDYEPADELDPCQAGTYRDGDHYRAVCGGGVYFDAGNVRTRRAARKVLARMLGRSAVVM